MSTRLGYNLNVICLNLEMNDCAGYMLIDLKMTSGGGHCTNIVFSSRRFKNFKNKKKRKN